MARRDIFFLAGLIGLALLIALPILTYPLGRDQGMYANIARTILDGGLPFIDMWDIKPPAIYYIYAAGISLFGSGSAALRAIDLAVLPFTLATLYWISLRLTGKRPAAFLTGMLFTVFYFTETFASLTQSDSLVTLPMSLAVLGVLKAGDAPRGSRAALFWSGLTGILCAATIWFKHYYAIFVLALVVHHLLHRLQAGARHADNLLRAFPFKEALAFALGGLPVGLLPLLYFMSNGIWQEMLYVAQGTAQYNAQSAGSFSDFVTQMGHYVAFRWQHWGVLLILAALWLLLPGLQRRGWRIVWFWLIAGLAFVLVQAKGFDTHWLPMLPPLTLLAGAALDHLLTYFVPPQMRVLKFSVMLYTMTIIALAAILLKDTWVRALPYLTGAVGERAYYQNFQANDLKPAESLQVIRFLQKNTQPGDTLYIFGFRPEVYYLTGLRPASRFQAQFPLVATWWRPEWKPETVETLWAALPAYVLVLQADYMPWVTGTDDDSATILAHDASLQDLEDWLIFNYERQEPVGNFLIWRRKTSEG